MRANFNIEEPDKLEATIHITMPLSQWKELSAQLTNSYPSWKLSSVITSLVYQAQKTFVETDAE